MQLTIQQENLPHREVRLDVEIPWTEVKGAYDKAFSEIAGQVQLPGFRKGKVPAAQVEKRFGDHIKVQAIEDLLPKAYEVAAKEKDLKAYGQARIEDVSEFKSGEALKAKYRVALMPLCELKDAAGLNLVEPQVQWDETDVLTEVRAYGRSRAKLEDGDGVAADDSWVRVEVKFTDESFAAQNLSGAPFLVETMADRPLPFRKTDVIGMKAGESKTLTRDFSKDFEIADLAGKSAEFTLTVAEVKKFAVPEVTDELAKEFQFADLADMKAKIRERFTERAEDYRVAQLRRQVLDQLKPRAKLEVAHATTHAVAHQLIDNFYQRNGVTDKTVDRFLQAIGKTADQIHHDFEELAAREIADELIGEELAKLFPVEVGDEKINAEIEKLAQRTQREAKELRRDMLKSGAFSNLKRRLGENEMLLKVIAQSKMTPGDKISIQKIDA